MGVVEKVRLPRRIPETLAAPSDGVGFGVEATLAVVTETSGLTIVTKTRGGQDHPVGQNKSNLDKLRRQAEEFVAARERVHHTIALEERKSKRIDSRVLNWLNSVDEVIETVDTFLKGECQTKTKGLQGWLAKTKTLVNPLSKKEQGWLAKTKTLVNPLSKKATKLEQVVVELYAKRDFPCVSYSFPAQEELSISATSRSTADYVAFDSRTSILESIMDELTKPDTDMILVHGIGGVGKTTLVKEVFRKAREESFEDVVMVLNIKQNPDLERIQQEILEKFGMDVVGEETMAERSRRLFEKIKDKKTPVVLSDFWKRIDLEAIGLHHTANCKILLTSRTKLVLSGQIRPLKVFGLYLLSEEESWSLFKKIAGDVVKEDGIQSLAIQIAKKCGGLPLLIVTVASALKGSRLHEWKDVLRRLQKFDKKDLRERADLALEWSCNQLKDDELRQLFLLCGITAARSTDSIVLGDLLKYGMGLSLFKHAYRVEEKFDALHSLVSKLKDSCLLQDCFDDTRIRMHDLVCDVATMIASRDHHVLSVGYGDELKELPDKDFFEKCTVISLPSREIPRFPSVPWRYPELKMFTLRGLDHDSFEFPLKFFDEMKVLKVLDLTNLCIQSLQSLQVLTNLQTLCLHQCVLEGIAMLGQLRSLEVLSFFNSQFKQLPREIAELTHLRLLDLTDCSELETIPPNVISSLTRLEDLRMRNSFNQWEAEQVTGERSNASLSELKYLSKLTALDIHIPDGNLLPAKIFSPNYSSRKLERYHIIIGDEWTWHNVDETSNTLKLKITPSKAQLDEGLKMLLKRSDDWHLDLLDVVGDIVKQFDNEDFQQLKHLHVLNSAYAGSKEIILENELESLMQHFMSEKVTFPNLRSLSLYQCGGSRFLLSSSMARSFVQLKHLQISRCESVEEIVSTDNMSEPAGLVFPTLEILEVVDCVRLTSLGLSAVSFKKLTTLEVIGCHELKYLLTYSVAKSLFQLRRMEVKNCKRLKVMVISDEGHGAENEIVFGGMQHLELSSLPRLQGFCSDSEHDIAKFPVLETIVVSDCPVLLKISPDGVLRSESKPERVVTIEVEEEADDNNHHDGGKIPPVVPQIEPNIASLQETLDSIPVLLNVVLPLTATQQRLQAALALLRSPSSSSQQSPEVAAAKATLLELVNRPIDEVVDHDLESRYHSACSILVKHQVLSAGMVQGLNALLLELYGHSQRCCTITSDLASLKDKPDQEASIANSIESLAQICDQQGRRSHQLAERISMLRQELLLEEEAKAKVDQELEDNLKQLDRLQDQLVAIRNDCTKSQALQVELISQKNKYGATWESIRFILHKQLES